MSFLQQLLTVSTLLFAQAVTAHPFDQTKHPSMSPNDVAFVLVPGSFSPPAFYQKVAYSLGSQGYITVPTELQSANFSGIRAPASMYDDADYIANTVNKLLDQGKDVVIAMNSYGGFPGSEAVKNIDLKGHSHGHDKRGTLIGLVYLASFLPDVGESITSITGNASVVDIGNDPDYLTLNLDLLATNAFNKLAPRLRTYHSLSGTQQSRISFQNTLTYPGYRYVPSTFLVSLDDHIIPTARQFEFVRQANDRGANVRQVTVDADHIAMLSRPEVVVRVLLEAAGKRQIQGNEL